MIHFGQGKILSTFGKDKLIYFYPTNDKSFLVFKFLGLF
jgi:hypothetical protein